MPGLILPSYKQGYARYMGEARFPELWPGLQLHGDISLGPTGETLRDTSGRHNHGTLTNMDPATDWVMTENGWALDTNGGYINFLPGQYKPVGDGDFSFSGYFAFNAASSTWRYLINQGETTDTAGVWGLAIHNNSVRFFSWPSGGSAEGTWTNVNQSDMTVANAPWRHIAITRHASDGSVDIYINGVLENTAAGQTGDLAAAASTKAMAFGRKVGVNDTNWLGKLTNFATWDRVLTPSEILTLSQYPNAISQRKPRQYWFAPAGGPSFQAAWAQNINNLIGVA